MVWPGDRDSARRKPGRCEEPAAPLTIIPRPVLPETEPESGKAAKDSVCSHLGHTSHLVLPAEATRGREEQGWGGQWHGANWTPVKRGMVKLCRERLRVIYIKARVRDKGAPHSGQAAPEVSSGSTPLGSPAARVGHLREASEEGREVTREGGEEGGR